MFLYVCCIFVIFVYILCSYHFTISVTWLLCMLVFNAIVQINVEHSNSLSFVGINVMNSDKRYY